MIKKAVIGIVIMQLLTSIGYAQDYNPLSKLGRGMANICLGWTEIFRQMIKVKEEREEPAGDIAGFFWGPLKGISYFITRTVVGAYEIATFVAPTYKPLIEPEYIFADEQSTKQEEE